MPGKRAREAAPASVPPAPAAPVAGPSTGAKKRRKTTHAANESGATADSAVVLAADTSEGPVPVEAEDDEAERARRRKAKGKGRAVDPPQPNGADEDPQKVIARLRAELDHKTTVRQSSIELADRPARSLPAGATRQAQGRSDLSRLPRHVLAADDDGLRTCGVPGLSRRMLQARRRGR